MEVRPATLADVPAIAAANAAAYLDDPMMRWLVRGSDRLERLRRFFAASIAQMIRAGAREVYTTPDVAGSAQWAAPGTCRLPMRTMLPAVPAIARAIRAGLFKSARMYAALHAAHPQEPHWYLEGIGVDPARQRTGVGGALMRPVLERCDREGLAAYLETQKHDNVPFYARHGFAVVGERDLPWGGPHMWLMLRPSAGG